MPRVVLIGDFLAPLPEIRAAVSQLSAIPTTGHMLQVLDPAELDLPYEGRVRFFGVRREGEMLIPRVESVRGAYAERMAHSRKASPRSAPPQAGASACIAPTTRRKLPCLRYLPHLARNPLDRNASACRDFHISIVPTRLVSVVTR